MSTNTEHRKLAAIIFTDMVGYSLTFVLNGDFEPRSIV
jgi:hypothetical protein